MINKNFFFIIRKFNLFGATNNSLDFILSFKIKNQYKKILFERISSENIENYYTKTLKKSKIKFYILDNFFLLSNKYLVIAYYQIRKFFLIKLLTRLKLILLFYFYKPKIIYFNYIFDFKEYSFLIKNNEYILHIHLQHSKLKKINQNQISVIQKAKKIISTNEITSNILINYVNEDKIINYNLALPIKKIDYLQKNYDDRKINNYLHIIKDLKSKNKIIVANFSSFSERKGSDIFLDTARLASDTNSKEFFFIWFGYNKKNSYIYKKNFLDLKNILLYEPITNIFPIIALVDIILITSRDESGPLLLLEGMYFEKLCITHVNCGFSKKVIGKNKFGICVDENSSNLYFDLIKSFDLSSTELKIIKKNAKKNILENFNNNNTKLGLNDI